MSLELDLATLTLEEQAWVLEGLADDELEALLYSWEFAARPDQWEVTRAVEHIVLQSGGRGSGKTRTGSEWVRDGIERSPVPLIYHLVARTAADVRDVMVRGESGLMNVFPPSQKPRYLPSERRIEFHDGSVGLMFSAEKPAQLRGPQSHRTWADEMAAWSHRPDDSGLTAWDNVKIGTRLGENPQILVTTTPKRTGPVPGLYEDALKGNKGVRLVTASTFDNPHLSSTYRETIEGLYGGTRLGSQELFAVLLEDVEGALWHQKEIDSNRVLDDPGKLAATVVAVDPSVAENPRDECGIVVAGATGGRPHQRHGYVLDDRSLLAPPSKWAKVVVDTAREYDAPVIAEINNGGALVKDALHSIDPKIRVKTVSAKKSKKLRAEPVQAIYEQGRIHHYGTFGSLEDQMTSWVPGETKDSPDRVDALVYALTALVVSEAGVGQTTVHRPRGQVPTGAGSVVNLSRYRR